MFRDLLKELMEIVGGRLNRFATTRRSAWVVSASVPRPDGDESTAGGSKHRGESPTSVVGESPNWLGKCSPHQRGVWYVRRPVTQCGGAGILERKWARFGGGGGEGGRRGRQRGVGYLGGGSDSSHLINNDPTVTTKRDNAPVVEPETLLDGDHGIDRTFQVWAELFFYLAENNVVFEDILLKPSIVNPGAESKDKKPHQKRWLITLSNSSKGGLPSSPWNHGEGKKMVNSQDNTTLSRELKLTLFVAMKNAAFVWWASKVEATLNLNAMNQGPNLRHVSLSYAQALQNTCRKAWAGFFAYSSKG
ncbi:UNVERIFIED_CONTAM: Fructose-bisphosphate aldolase, chloroplastic [Sesamum radiatum]|uniref:fructose-bisphosphate aldolase n=1 Tax=Sesamum radiatum TaxID=300843 RepID=A0AAW2REG0_SESRA